MSTTPTILLIGLRGSGKSTLGRLLARRLGVGFDDLDERTLARLGCASVAQAWASLGESAFRAAEVEALREAAAGGGVIALGGGTPTAPGAGAAMLACGAITVYLRGEPPLLRARLEGAIGDDRPSLTGADPLDEIERVFARRDAPYRELADHTLELVAHEQPDETLRRLVGVIG
ncbi:MAG: shikimate kinase [Phycisphaeraceae bacterium]|nr:shikimate kinase [Phycisphaeraceae bacterium]MCB9847418.1 shikimate kinase [Phycisphaeraceae bacterium]